MTEAGCAARGRTYAVSYKGVNVRNLETISFLVQTLASRVGVEVQMEALLAVERGRLCITFVAEFQIDNILERDLEQLENLESDLVRYRLITT